MLYDFKDKVVLVTGASSGIGEATARMFAKAQAKVILVARREALLKDIVDDLTKNGYQASYFICDVTDETGIKDMISYIEKEYGKLDFAFNNAGIMPDDKKTANVPTEEFDKVMNVNFRSIFLSMKYELQLMSKQDNNTNRAIVNCSSIGGLIGTAGRSVYHASKHAVTGLTKSSALEYATQNIRINAVCPATIETPMVESMRKTGAITGIAEPIGRTGTPDEVANVVLWLCSQYSTYVIGQSIAVDGGYTIQ